jgi:hypothetical protein
MLHPESSQQEIVSTFLPSHLLWDPIQDNSKEIEQNVLCNPFARHLADRMRAEVHTPAIAEFGPTFVDLFDAPTLPG